MTKKSDRCPKCGAVLLEEYGILYCLSHGVLSSNGISEEVKKSNRIWTTYRDNRAKKKTGRNTYNAYMRRIKRTFFGG